MRKFLQMSAVPKSWDAGLLALRLMGVVPLLLKHGLEKVFTFSAMAAHFPDPLHIGAVPSLLFAMLSDSICTVLMIAGLWTRWAALITFVNVAVAWAFVHHFEFFGHGADHGEAIVLYLAILATLFFAGAGKYSVDGALQR
jgi:putative oxidoreductase